MLSGSGSSTPVPSSPRSSVFLDELDLCSPSQSTPVSSGSGSRKATVESVVQELVHSESVYVEELAAIIKVRLLPPPAASLATVVLYALYLHLRGSVVCAYVSPMVVRAT